MPTVNDVMQVVDLLRSKPVIIAEERCVAVRNRNSTCRRCAEACPVDAVTVSKNRVSIDPDTCMGCGACIAVCPTSAVEGVEPTDAEIAAEIVAAAGHAQGVAVIACERMTSKQVGDPEGYATVSCLARIDEALLVSLVAQGIDDIVLVDGNCSTCKYGVVSSRVDDTVESAAGLLEMRGEPCVFTRDSEFPPEARVEDTGKAAAAARRGFFTGMGGYARNVAFDAARRFVTNRTGGSQGSTPRTLRERIGAGKNGKLPTFQADRNMRVLDDLCNMGELCEPEVYTRLFGAMSIDASECSGCGMCVLFCPTEAVKYSEVEEPEDEKRRYLEFQVADCVQCGLCTDVCLRRCLKISSAVPTGELFDFEPRLIEIPRAQHRHRYLNRFG